jgi:hypothetical protein
MLMRILSPFIENGTEISKKKNPFTLSMMMEFECYPDLVLVYFTHFYQSQRGEGDIELDRIVFHFIHEYETITADFLFVYKQRMQTRIVMYSSDALAFFKGEEGIKILKR